ncbi:hypothetical protein XacyCFBP2565_14570 [Xanthomonas arboricola pv. corylina]|nr:hypothetical protein XacyCFBP2565_14570 [Xanthomonas arboricola pv. corylina]
MHAAKGPATGKDTAPGSWSMPARKAACRNVCRVSSGTPVSSNAHHALLLTMHTDHLDWSLSAHRRGTLRGMDAA